MKNKHLLLLFLTTIAVGLLARRLPWFKANIFQTDLIQVDTSAVTQISILQSGQPELLLDRTEEGWAAAQDNRSVALSPEHISPMLEALSPVRSIRIVKTTRPDTLGFSERTRVQVVVFKEKEMLDQFEIGYQTYENKQPATFIRLNRHEGIYLIEGHIRNAFAKKLLDFRENTVAQFDPKYVKKIVVKWREDGLIAQYPVYKNDSTGQWEPLGQVPPVISNDTMQAWLRLFAHLNGSPFADHFDESRKRETFLAGATLHFSSSDSLIFNVYYVKPPDMPEEISVSNAKWLPLYVLHSSQNPRNYFAPADTALLRRVCFGLVPPIPNHQKTK